MSQQRHIIGQTILELNTGNLADVWSLQEEVSRLFQQQAVPEIERLFDRLVGTHEVIRLERVVVEAGAVDRRFLANEWLSQLLAALNQTLNDALQNAVVYGQPVNPDSTEQPTLIRRDRSGADWEVLLFFLQYGRLPWWITAGNWQSWFSRWEAVMEGNTNWRSPLQELLATDWAARQRLVEQFPDSFRHQLMVRMQPTGTRGFALLAQAQQLMRALGLSSGATRQLEQQAWRLFLSEITPEQDLIQPSTAIWIRHWLESVVLKYLEEVAPEVSARRSDLVYRRLRDSLETLTAGDRDFWLTALDQVRVAPLVDLPELPCDLEIWLYFLQQGRLPMEASAQDWSDWLSRWEALMQSDTSWREALLVILAANPTARQRLVDQFPEAFLHQLIAQVQPLWIGWYALLAQARQVLRSLNLSDDTIRPLEEQAWLLLFSEMVSGDDRLRPLPTANWVRSWLVQLLGISVDSSSDPFARPEREEMPLSNVYRPLRAFLEATAIDDQAIWLRELEQAIALLSRNLAQSEQAMQEVTVLPIWLSRPPSQPSNTSALSPEEEASGLYVTQAGLVLLHPFVSYYFDAIGLLAGESFRDETAQQFAIYLLHYLATKQTDAPEYELVLPKLLCGWAFDKPVERGLALPIAALSEGEHLLQTVINYWEVLKSTSPDGLREGFLQREGKLTPTNGRNWKLQVEQKAIDILLGRLPWGLSMVTLPWMEGLLTVEWM